MDELDTGRPAAKDESPLATYTPADGCVMWRAVEPDAPGLFAIIANEQCTGIPNNPEADNMVIAIFDEGLPETLDSIEIDGRSGLNRWYLKNVGYEPDKEPGGPLPIEELINTVAGHLMLCSYEASAENT